MKYKTEQIVIETLQKHHSLSTTPTAQQIKTGSIYQSMGEYQGQIYPDMSPKSLKNEKSTLITKFSELHTPHGSAKHGLNGRESKKIRPRSQGFDVDRLQLFHSDSCDYKLLFEQLDSKVKQLEDVNKLQVIEIQSLHQQLQAERHNLANSQEQHNLKVHQLEEEKRACNHLFHQAVMENKRISRQMKKILQQNQQLLSSKESEIKNLESTIQDYSKELHRTSHTVQHYKDCNSELQKQLTEVKVLSELKFSEMILEVQAEKETAVKEQKLLHNKNLEVMEDDFRRQLERMDMDRVSLALKCDGLEKLLTESQETTERYSAENSSLKKELILLQRKDKKVHQLLEASRKEAEESVCKSADLETTINELQQDHVALKSQNEKLEATIKHLHKNLIQCENDKKKTMKAVDSLNYQLESKEQIARQRQSELKAYMTNQNIRLIQALILHNPNALNTNHQLSFKHGTTGSYAMKKTYSPASLLSLAIESLKLHEQDIPENLNQRVIHIKFSKSRIYKFNLKITTGGTLYVLCCILVYLCLVFVPLLW